MSLFASEVGNAGRGLAKSRSDPWTARAANVRARRLFHHFLCDASHLSNNFYEQTIRHVGMQKKKD